MTKFYLDKDTLKKIEFCCWKFGYNLMEEKCMISGKSSDYPLISIKGTDTYYCSNCGEKIEWYKDGEMVNES